MPLNDDEKRTLAEIKEGLGTAETAEMAEPRSSSATIHLRAGQADVHSTPSNIVLYEYGVHVADGDDSVSIYPWEQILRVDLKRNEDPVYKLMAEDDRNDVAAWLEAVAKCKGKP